MYRGRVGIKYKNHWQYKTFAMVDVEDVYTLAEIYRSQWGSYNVSIKFEEVDEYDAAN